MKTLKVSFEFPEHMANGLTAQEIQRVAKRTMCSALAEFRGSRMCAEEYVSLRYPYYEGVQRSEKIADVKLRNRVAEVLRNCVASTIHEDLVS